MGAEAPLRVEVVYAGVGGVLRRRLCVPAGTTAWAAVACSGLLDALPAGSVDALRLGIFARRVQPETVLAEGDRVELYRPLAADPKDARRRRASRSR